jgi:acetoin utilization deacetylase AcuC-like enzyme
MRGQGMGFCLLNNVALAAEALLQNSNAKQLAIVDLDLHHGNGTQDIFWQRGEVMYISTHQRPLFPGTGSLDEVGQGAGYKTTANFPLPPGSGDEAFRVIMDQAILPLLQRYKPEMVLVSYGFDTHWSDPLGFLCLTADGYAKIISSLRDYTENECSGRIAVFLEGGYNLEAAEVCTVGIVNALLGQDWEDPLGPSPYSATRTWLEMFQQARAFWDL